MRSVTFFSSFILGFCTFNGFYPAYAILNQSDKVILSRIGSEIARGNFQSALAQKNQLSNKSAQNYIDWKYLTDPATTPSYLEIAKFVKYNQDMPRKHILREKLEIAIASQPEDIQKKYYLNNNAVTVDGKIQEIRFLFANNQTTQAKQQLLNIWYNDPLNAHQTQKIITNFRSYLTQQDFSERIERLLDLHFINDSEKLLSYGTSLDRQKHTVRKHLIRLNSGALATYQNASSPVQQDAGVLRSLVHFYRKTNRDNQAIQVISHLTPTQSSDNPQAWSNHRAVLSRVAYKNGQISQAYAITAANYLTEGAEFVDAEFYAGWLALRHLNKPSEALSHFQKARAKSLMPISISRFEYWIGRSCQKTRDTQCSESAFKRATNYFYTFYGQLAALELGQNSLTIPAPEKADERVRNAFFSDNTIQAAYAAHAMGNLSDSYLMLLSVAQRPNKHQAIHSLLEDITLQMLDTTAGVRIAKASSVHNSFLIKSGYPIRNFNQHAGGLEKALIFALTRQESEFDPYAQSGVGARGLMQLMPTTAKIVARQLGKPFQVSLLTQNPDYNMTLGSKYLHDMILNFSGSYINALSAYNAGPGRIPQWNQSYGRFSRDLYHTIDRIEMIPFSETRNYVQRILEAVQVYRAKLSGRNSIDLPKLASDLKRGT